VAGSQSGNPSDLLVAARPSASVAINGGREDLGIAIPQAMFATARELARIDRFLLHRTLVANGTKRTSRHIRSMSAFGGKADIAGTPFSPTPDP